MEHSLTFALEAGDVEILVLYAQHLPGALLLAGLAVRLPCKKSGADVRDAVCSPSPGDAP